MGWDADKVLQYFGVNDENLWLDTAKLSRPENQLGKITAKTAMILITCAGFDVVSEVLQNRVLGLPIVQVRGHLRMMYLLSNKWQNCVYSAALQRSLITPETIEQTGVRNDVADRGLIQTLANTLLANFARWGITNEKLAESLERLHREAKVDGFVYHLRIPFFDTGRITAIIRPDLQDSYLEVDLGEGEVYSTGVRNAAVATDKTPPIQLTRTITIEEWNKLDSQLKSMRKILRSIKPR